MNIANAISQTTVNVTATGTGGVSSRTDQLSYQRSYSLTQGSGANQVTGEWNDSRTLASSANETLIFTVAGGGTLKDAFGVAVDVATIKEILIENTSANSGTSLKVGLATNPFLGPLGGTGPFVTIPAGQIMHWRNYTAAGWAITASTNDSLKVLNLDGANAASYKIIVTFN